MPNHDSIYLIGKKYKNLSNNSWFYIKNKNVYFYDRELGIGTIKNEITEITQYDVFSKLNKSLFSPNKAWKTKDFTLKVRYLINLYNKGVYIFNIDINNFISYLLKVIVYNIRTKSITDDDLDKLYINLQLSLDSKDNIPMYINTIGIIAINMYKLNISHIK